jgi:hypothetical protein
MLNGIIFYRQGPSFKLTLDQNRQRFLALVSLLAAIFGLAGNGVELSDHPKSAGQSTASFFFNWFVQVNTEDFNQPTELLIMRF